MVLEVCKNKTSQKSSHLRSVPRIRYFLNEVAQYAIPVFFQALQFEISSNNLFKKFRFSATYSITRQI